MNFYRVMLLLSSRGMSALDSGIRKAPVTVAVSTGNHLNRHLAWKSVKFVGNEGRLGLGAD